MLTTNARGLRGLGLAALAVLALVSVASAAWLWEPKEQLTHGAPPLYDPNSGDGTRGHTAQTAWHQLVRVQEDPDHPAGNQALAYYLTMGADWDPAGAWAGAELVTDTASGQRTTDLNIAVGADEDAYVVSEVFYWDPGPPLGENYEPRIGFRHRDGTTWGAVHIISPDSVARGFNSPNLVLQDSGQDTLHVVFRRDPNPNDPGPQPTVGLWHTRKAIPDADGAWELPTSVTPTLAQQHGGSAFVSVESRGMVHFFGREKVAFGEGFVVRLLHLRGYPPGAGAWDLDSTKVSEHVEQAVVPPLGIESEDPARPLGVEPDGGTFHWAWLADSTYAGSPTSTVFYARGDSAGNWTTPVRLSPIDGVAGDPQVFVSGDGTIHLLYVDGGPATLAEPPLTDRRLLHIRSTDDGTTWSRPEDASAGARTVAFRPTGFAEADTLFLVLTSHDDDDPTPGSDGEYELWAQKGYAIADTLESANVTWSGSVYLDSDFEVQAGKTLTIEAGTRVFAAASSGAEKVDLIVNGQLLAIGTAYSPITFAPYDGAGDPGEWGGIRFTAGIDSRLEHVEIQGADQPIALVGGRADLLHLTVTDVTAGNADVLLDRDVKVGSGESWELAGLLSVAVEYPDAANQGRDAARVEIIVQGSLDAQGDALQDMTFGAASGQAGDWAGVLFDLAAAPSGYGFTTNSLIKGTEIRDATQGIAIRQTGAPSLDGVTFSNIVQDRHIVLDSTDVYLPYEGAWILTPGTVIKAAPVTRTGSDIGSPGAFLHAGKVDLVVHGRLHGVADVADRIRFEPVDVPGNGETTAGDEWGGIFFDWISAGASMHLLRFADIGYAATPLSLYYGDAVIEDCRIHHFKDRGIWMKSSFTWGPEIRRCSVFRDTTGTATLGFLYGRDGIVINDVLDATIEENTIRLDGMSNSLGGAALVVENAGGKFGFCYGTTAQPETLRVAANNLLGPGGTAPTGNGKWSGIKGTWMCGSGVRKVEVTDNLIDGWNGAGFDLDQAMDVQVTCNVVQNSPRAVTFRRNAEPTKPSVRYRLNQLAIGSYDQPNDQQVVWTDDAVKLELGPSGSVGANQLIALGEDFYAFENDEDAADSLSAQSNYWKRNGVRHTLPGHIRSWISKESYVSDAPRAHVSGALFDPPTGCGSAASRGATGGVDPENPSASLTGAPGGGNLPERTEIVVRGPSPSPGRTEIDLSLAGSEPRPVTVDVFDVAGRRVAGLVDEPLRGGRYRVSWDRRDERTEPVSAGVYFLRMRAGDVTQVRKIVVIR